MSGPNELSSLPPAEIEIARINGFWRNAGPDSWFKKDAGFDTAFRNGFLELHMAAASRQCDGWSATPEGSLALLLLLDQLPRNCFRGTAHMYATDALARYFARRALSAGHMEGVEAGVRVFFCLPFSHSEDIADQTQAVELNRLLGQPWLEHAEGHYEVIRRFGRFPHRNVMFGRATTAEEQKFLDDGGFAG